MLILRTDGSLLSCISYISYTTDQEFTPFVVDDHRRRRIPHECADPQRLTSEVRSKAVSISAIWHSAPARRLPRHPVLAAVISQNMC